MKKVIIPFLFFLFFAIFLLRDIFFDAYRFSQGKESYESKSYSGALEQFVRLSDASAALHNIGNTWYKVAETKSTEQEKFPFYYLALGAYSGALSLEENQYTRYNYQYIENLLNGSTSLEEQEENKQEKQEPDSGKEQNTEEQQSDTTEDVSDQGEQNSHEKKDSEQNLSQERGEQYILSEQDELLELSESEQQQLENYIEKLKQEQSQNQKYYGKQDSIDQRDVFESFLGNPFFQRDLGETQKDW